MPAYELRRRSWTPTRAAQTPSSRLWRAASILSTVLLLTCNPATGCGSSASSNVQPSLEFTNVPPAANGGPATLAPIAGRVAGARPNQQIVLFAKSGSVWWVQPFRSRPFTAIERDSTWKSTIHLGTEYAALLVEPDYQPPMTMESLPQQMGGGIVAVASVGGTGTFVPPPSRTLAFGGYDWEIRQLPNERHGRNDYDARNAWVDGDGHLHLLLTQRDGRWTSAEVQTTRSLGYGTYIVDVRDTSRLDPAAAFSLYTWDALGADHNYREMNVDISRWGDPRSMIAQYVVQPESVAANVFRFAIPPGLVTHSFRWAPSQVSFKTTQRSAMRRGDALVAERQFSAGVPVVGAEKVYMTLLFNRAARAPANDVEVVV